MPNDLTKGLPRHLLSLHWAVRPDWMRMALDVLSRRSLLAELPAARPQALEALPGEPHQRTDRASVRGAVGILSVRGVLCRHPNIITEWCGGTSYAQLAHDFQVLLDDSSVGAIVLDCDSPGGEVTGCGEFASLIYQARDRKPIVAYVDGSACSAAYWIASAAERVVTSPTGLLGSIGACATFFDDRDAMARDGYREIVLVSSQSPRKNADPATEGGQSDIIEILTAIAQVFVEDVALHRGVTPEKVLADFGRGGVLVGRAAVAQGLADELGDFESLVASLQQPGLPSSGRMARTAARSLQLESFMKSHTSRLAARTGAPKAVAAVGSGDEVTIRAERAVMCQDGDTGTVVEVIENVTAIAVETTSGIVKYLLEAEVDVTKAADGSGGGTPATDAAPAAIAAAAAPVAVLAGEIADVAALEARFPVLCQALRAEAATAERTRVTKIQALASKGPAKTLQACLDDPACSYEAAAARLLEAADVERTARGQAFRRDDKGIPIPAVETPAAESSTETRVVSILRSAAIAEGRVTQ
jgi:ClpP class serine protease